MVKTSVIVTGVRSFAGNRIFRAFNTFSGCSSFGIQSPRQITNQDPLPPGLISATNDTSIIVADLTLPLSEAHRTLIKSAGHRIFHFAWDRSLDPEKCLARNLAMVENIMQAMDNPNGLVFISTPSAGTGSISTYGKTKFALEKNVIENGGTVLIVGIVSSLENGSAYSAIKNMVCKTPFHFIFDPTYRFYPLDEDELIGSCSYFLDDFIPGTYLAFPPHGVSANDYLGIMEQECQRIRLPLYVPTKLLTAVIRMLKRLHLPWFGGIEKLATFLYSDTERLATLTCTDQLKPNR